MSKNRTAILILGAHRSGTSALTRMISLLGYELPQNLMTSLEGNEAGHWESEALAQMNDSVLEELNLAWYEWHPYRLDQIGSKRKEVIVEDVKSVLLKEYPGKKDFVIKDPRVCRLTEFVIPAIKQMPANLKIVIPFRNPLEVMASLEKRNSLSKPQGALIWLRYVLDAELGSRGEDRAFIPYEDYLNSPQESISTLCETLEIQPENSATKIKKQLQSFSRPHLKHHNYDHDMLLMEPVTRGWVSDTIKSLMILKDDADNNEALESLDTIRFQFEKVTPILKASLDALYASQEAKARAIKEEAEELRAQKEQAEGELSQLAGTLEHRNTEVIEAQEQLNLERTNLNETIERIEAEKKKHQTDYEKLAEEYETLTGTLQQVEAEKKKHQTDYEKLSKEYETTLKQRDTLQNANQNLEDKIEHFRAEHNLLLQEYERLASERTTLRETIGRIDTEKKKHQADYDNLSKEYDAVLKHRESLTVNSQKLEQRVEALSNEHTQLSQKLEKAKKEHLTLSNQLKENLIAKDTLERQHAEVITTKQSEISKLENAKTSLEDEVNHVRERLQQEQRTVIKPFLRQLRGAGGSVLRIFLPNKWVNKIALIAPTAEQKLLIEQQKIKASDYQINANPDH